MKQRIASEQPPTEELELHPGYDVSRRKFFQVTGGLAGLGLLLSACHKDPSSPAPTQNGTVGLGSGDTGVLNYAYALEQLEAAFYTKVISNPYSSMSTGEMALLTNIRDHEIAHREFFKAALAGNAIQALEVDFSSIDFTSRASVLATAKAFEDLGVSAYNGAGQLISNADYLVLAGKIVSVEARHAAYIRDLINYNSFADSTAVSTSGLDESNTPSAVVMVANNYLKTKIDASQL